MLLLAPMSLPMPVSVYSYAKASAYDHASVCSHACAPCTCLCPCVMPNAFAYAHDILPLAARYPLCWLFCELQFRINYTIWNYLLLAMNQYVFSFRIYDSIFINLYTFIASNYCFGTKYEILRVAYSNTVRSLHTHIPQAHACPHDPFLRLCHYLCLSCLWMFLCLCPCPCAMHNAYAHDISPRLSQSSLLTRLQIKLPLLSSNKNDHSWSVINQFLIILT